MEFKELVLTVEQILKDDIFPLEEKGGMHDFDTLHDDLEAVRSKVKAKGVWAPHLPKKWGGMGLSLEDFGIISELLGTSPFGHYLFNCQAPDVGNMEILHEFGTSDQKDSFLKPLVNGDIRSCFSMTEPEFAGSNPLNMGTTAVKEGNEWVINGHKWFTTAADGASFAIVMAITNPDTDSPYKRASQIIVPTDTPGFELVRNISIMGDKGSGYASHAEIRYTNCRVPLENLLGGEGEGFSIAQSRLGPGRIHHCMRWIGICERAFKMMCERAATRELKSGYVLGRQQTIENWIAESRVEIDASRMLVLDTARKIDEEGAEAAKLQISGIKFYVANVLQQVLDKAIQVHGALGITDDTLLAGWYRHERGARIYDGPDEVHKSRIARSILKQYRK